VKTGVGLRLPVYGVFEHADMVGLDLVKAVQDYVLPDVSTVREAGRLHQEKVARGDLGVKAGCEFLERTPEQAQTVRDAFLMQFLRRRRERMLLCQPSRPAAARRWPPTASG
jgi:3-hydroxybutyryl-CoA dehydrogenase